MILALLLACTGNDTPPTQPAHPPVAPPEVQTDAYDLSQKADHLNVILIDVDAMRADFLTPEFAPNLVKLAGESIQFTQASSSASWTVPATMAMWTGLWPSRHKIVNKLTPDATGEMVFSHLGDEIPTFPDLLVQKGWRAAAFTGGAGVQARFGYNRGFETYLDDKVFGGFDHSLPPARDWVDANADAHFFLFLHGYDAHGQHPLMEQSPREAVPGYTGKLDGSIEEQARFRELGLAAIQKAGDPPQLDMDPADLAFLKAVYGAKIKEADARVGAMIDHLRARGILDRSIVVVVSDHGEEFGEHGYIDHGATLCEHQLHVPLFFRLPGGEHQVIDTPVRTIDLFPTVFDLLGYDLPVGIDGQSLLPAFRGEKPKLDLYAESDYRLFVHLRSLRKGSDKLLMDLEDGEKQLFDLASDPAETAPQANGDARVLYELEQGIRKAMLEASADPQSFLGVHQEPVKVY
jgi:choline-sulfatase